MSYEELLIESEKYNLIVKEKELPGYKGRIYKNRIAIKKDIPTLKEKSCILAEELGHYHTTSGNILDQSKAENRKQELKARLWAYNKQIGLMGLVEAYKHGCQDRHETAEYLGVTEEFLNRAITAYRNKYGLFVQVDNYSVYFEPALGVTERR